MVSGSGSGGWFGGVVPGYGSSMSNLPPFRKLAHTTNVLNVHTCI